MATPFLSLRGITKSFSGVHALKGIDFEIDDGEIHCLAGANGSGKSTLVNILAGAYQPDAGGSIAFSGTSQRHVSAIGAIHHGVGVIYQDLSLFPTLSVAENIAISQLIAQGKSLVRQRLIDTLAAQALERIGISLPLDEMLGNLSMADQQLVAICRAFTREVKLLIMDEPTTALTRKEVDALFRVILDLKKRGAATLFISHKLDEVFEIAERVTILRDGEKIGTYHPSELDHAKLSQLMTGMSPSYEAVVPPDQSTVPLLEVRGLSRPGNFRDVSLRLLPGEVLGITGLLGSGRTELALALFGLNPASTGSILRDGQPVSIRSVRDAMGHGIAYVPENRLLQGLVLHQSVAKNLMLTLVRQLRTRLGFIDPKKQREQVCRWIKEFKIKAPSPDACIETLSGGNQQRVVLAKWIAMNPKILILDNPTVGVDIAAKSGIHTIIRNLAEKGMGIIIISDEVDELVHTCNRVAVMAKGRIGQIFSGDGVSIQGIARAIAGNHGEVVG